jgi:hypothetical protein
VAPLVVFAALAALTLSRVLAQQLTHWQADPAVLGLSAAALVGYVVGVSVLRIRRRRWKARRTVCWIAGLALWAVTACSGAGGGRPTPLTATPTVNMPLLALALAALAAGAPVTLVTEVAPERRREALRRVLCGRLSRLLLVLLVSVAMAILARGRAMPPWPWGLLTGRNQTWGREALWGLGGVVGVLLLVAVLARLVHQENAHTAEVDRRLDAQDAARLAVTDAAVVLSYVDLEAAQFGRPWWETDPRFAGRYGTPRK